MKVKITGSIIILWLSAFETLKIQKNYRISNWRTWLQFFFFEINKIWIYSFSYIQKSVAIFPFISGCALSYDIRAYPLLEKVNSQINEQQNAAIKRLKAQLSYLSPENFMRHAILYLWNRNYLKRQLCKQTFVPRTIITLWSNVIQLKLL